jgi:hypothetical protein
MRFQRVLRWKRVPLVPLARKPLPVNEAAKRLSMNLPVGD